VYPLDIQGGEMSNWMIGSWAYIAGPEEAKAFGIGGTPTPPLCGQVTFPVTLAVSIRDSPPR
jgi:hypothetical protein